MSQHIKYICLSVEARIGRLLIIECHFNCCQAWLKFERFSLPILHQYQCKSKLSHVKVRFWGSAHIKFMQLNHFRSYLSQANWNADTQRSTMLYFNDGSSQLIVRYIYSSDSEGACSTPTTLTITQALDCQRLIATSISNKIPFNFHNEQIVFREEEWLQPLLSMQIRPLPSWLLRPLLSTQIPKYHSLLLIDECLKGLNGTVGLVGFFVDGLSVSFASVASLASLAKLAVLI